MAKNSILNPYHPYPPIDLSSLTNSTGTISTWPTMEQQYQMLIGQNAVPHVETIIDLDFGKKLKEMLELL